MEVFTQREFTIDLTKRNEVENLMPYIKQNTDVQVSFGEEAVEWSKLWVELLGPLSEVKAVQTYIECVANYDDLLVFCKLSSGLLAVFRSMPSLKWHVESNFKVAMFCKISVIDAEEGFDLLGEPGCALKANIALEVLDIKFQSPHPNANGDLKHAQLVNHCVHFGIRRKELAQVCARTLRVVLGWLETQDDMKKVEKICEREREDVEPGTDQHVEPEADEEVEQILNDNVQLMSELHTISSDDEDVEAPSTSSNKVKVDNKRTGLSEVSLEIMYKNAEGFGCTKEQVDIALEKCSVDGQLPSVSSVMQELTRLKNNSPAVSCSPIESSDTPPRRKSRMAAMFPPEGTGTLVKKVDSAQVGKKPGFFKPAAASCSESANGTIIPNDSAYGAAGGTVKDTVDLTVSKPSSSQTKPKKRTHSESAVCSRSPIKITPASAATDEQLGQQKQRSSKREKLLAEQKQLLTASTRDESLAKNMFVVPFECHDSPPNVEPQNLRHIVIDGSNVACAFGNNQVYDSRGILIAVQYFLDRGHPKDKVIAVVPRFRTGARHCQIPTRYNDILSNLEKQGVLVFTPSRVLDGQRQVPHDDTFILDIAADKDAVVVSNDQYRNFLADPNPSFSRYAPVIRERLLSYCMVPAIGTIYFAQDPFGVGGVSLDQLLSLVPLTPHRQKAQFIGAPPPGALLPPPQFGGIRGAARSTGIQNNPPRTDGVTSPNRKHKKQQQKGQHQQQALLELKQQQQQALDQLLSLFPDNRNQLLSVLSENPTVTDVNTLSNLLMDKICSS